MQGFVPAARSSSAAVLAGGVRRAAAAASRRIRELLDMRAPGGHPSGILGVLVGGPETAGEIYRIHRYATVVAGPVRRAVEGAVGDQPGLGQRRQERNSDARLPGDVHRHRLRGRGLHESHAEDPSAVNLDRGIVASCPGDTDHVSGLRQTRRAADVEFVEARRGNAAYADVLGSQ